jgi:hypothetical protein
MAAGVLVAGALVLPEGVLQLPAVDNNCPSRKRTAPSGVARLAGQFISRASFR